MIGHISTYATIIKDRQLQSLPCEVIAHIVDYATPAYKSSSVFNNVSLMFHKMVRNAKRNILIVDVKDYYSYNYAPKIPKLYDTIVVYSSIDGGQDDKCAKRLKNLFAYVCCNRLIIECNNPIKYLFSTIVASADSIKDEVVIVTDILPKIAKEKKRNNITHLIDHQYMGLDEEIHPRSYALTFNRNQIPESANSSNEFYRYAYTHTHTP